MKILKGCQFFFGFVFLCSLFFAGYFISQKSWDGQVFIYLQDTDSPSINARNIASLKTAVRRGGQLNQERGKTLIRSAKIKHAKDSIQFHLGHFLVQSKGGGSVLACQEYQTVDMVFIAGGVSVHGHVPKMLMKAKCKFDLSQPLRIGPFFVPKAKILSSSVNKKLFKSAEDQTIVFSDVSIRWPERWILSEARFTKEDSKKDLTVAFSSNKEEDFLTLTLR